MHRISHVAVTNFRSCISFQADLSDFTALVGYNNGGKSNLLSAIKWGVRGSILQEQDFNDVSKAVSITLRIEGVTTELLGKVDQKHRPRIEPFCCDNVISIRRCQPTPGGSKGSISLEILSPEGEWKKNPAGIDAAIAALFPEPIEIGAMEDAAEDVSKSKTNTTIGKLIAEVIQPIEEQHGAAIEQALEDIRRKLDAEGVDRAPELVSLDEGTNTKLRDIFPGLKIRVHVPPPEIKEIFKSGTIKVFEDDSPTARDVEALGHGAQRSIQMALVRHLAEVRRSGSTDPTRTLLLIDEPELYLHPHGIEQVRLALKSLSSKGYQVIFSTHSPLLIKADDVANALIIQKDPGIGTYARTRIADAVKKVVADEPSQAEILFEFSNLSQVLFTDRVLLAEGSTERRLLPELYEAFRARSLGAGKIGLVTPNGSGGIRKCMKILEAIGINAFAAVDLDYAFRGGLAAGIFSQDDDDICLCRDLCGRRADIIGYSLADDGFPKTSGAMTAAKAFELLADDVEMLPLISRLRERLLEHRYWIWNKGTIESHLGITGKNFGSHSAFVRDLKQKGFPAVVKDAKGIAAFFDWLDG